MKILPPAAILIVSGMLTLSHTASAGRELRPILVETPPVQLTPVAAALPVVTPVAAPVPVLLITPTVRPIVTPTLNPSPILVAPAPVSPSIIIYPTTPIIYPTTPLSPP